MPFILSDVEKLKDGDSINKMKPEHRLIQNSAPSILFILSEHEKQVANLDV